MSINKQERRQTAENATPGEWCADDMFGVVADAGLNGNFYIATCSGPENRDNKRFIAAANPATMLAQLDELEVATEACNGWQQKYAEADERLRVSEIRIAELEARTIKLPDAISWEEKDYLDEVVEAISASGFGIAAGITVKVDPLTAPSKL